MFISLHPHLCVPVLFTLSLPRPQYPIRRGSLVHLVDDVVLCCSVSLVAWRLRHLDLRYTRLRFELLVLDPTVLPWRPCPLRLRVRLLSTCLLAGPGYPLRCVSIVPALFSEQDILRVVYFHREITSNPPCLPRSTFPAFYNTRRFLPYAHPISTDPVDPNLFGFVNVVFMSADATS